VALHEHFTPEVIVLVEHPALREHVLQAVGLSVFRSASGGAIRTFGKKYMMIICIDAATGTARSIPQMPNIVAPDMSAKILATGCNPTDPPTILG
jgi:hypothetical protein